MNSFKSALMAIVVVTFASRSAYAETVTVKPGDTLQKISMQHFGTTRRWKEIMSWNADVLKDGQAIEVGMVLQIQKPATPVVEAAPGATPVVEAAAPVMTADTAVFPEEESQEVPQAAQVQPQTQSIPVDAARIPASSQPAATAVTSVENAQAPAAVIPVKAAELKPFTEMVF